MLEVARMKLAGSERFPFPQSNGRATKNVVWHITTIYVMIYFAPPPMIHVHAQSIDVKQHNNAQRYQLVTVLYKLTFFPRAVCCKQRRLVPLQLRLCRYCSSKFQNRVVQLRLGRSKREMLQIRCETSNGVLQNILFNNITLVCDCSFNWKWSASSNCCQFKQTTAYYFS